MNDSDSSECYALLNRLADEFATRYRNGERPSLQEYCERHPDLADDIREVLPALVEMEQAKQDRSATAPPNSESGPGLSRLGDFRIVRQVGRGGMGVVYEAEQESLGRRVALKVLPTGSLRDEKQRRRFEREAKSAARLHHTNIVPVFGSGEHAGTPYYVMQFIRGLGLDEVIEEVRRLGSSCSDVPSSSRAAPRPACAEAVARSLVTGEFEAGTTDGEPAPCDDLTGVTVASLPPTPRPDSSGSHSSLSLPGHSGEGRSRRSRKLTYWQSVARICVQVADALEYAHKQGVLHRDVKPSNLLLDMQGNTWVTDFGLAKADDHQDLTHTGDILGTLRYMAPEAFEGKTDSRSDVYSLGLTLYELLALRPAFDERNRNKLIKQVTTEEPPRLGLVRSDVPRDLATIVEKATEKSPVLRYQSAGELAADLERFLEDEPIHARRVSSAERLVRWARRNRGLAASLATAAVLLLVVAIGSGVTAVHFRQQEREQSKLAADNKALADDRAKLAGQHEEAARDADEARRAAMVTLADTQTVLGLLAAERDDPATAAVWFANAATLTPHDPRRQQANRLRARNWLREAPVPVAALSMGGKPRVVEVRPAGDLVLMLGENDRCTVWDWRSERELPWVAELGPATAVCLKPDGSQIAVALKSGVVEVREIPSGKMAVRVTNLESVTSLAFVPDGRRLITCGLVARVWDLGPKPTVIHEWRHPATIHSLAINAKGDRLATACADQKVRVFAIGAERPAPLFPPVPHDIAYRSANAINPPAFVAGDRWLATLPLRQEKVAFDLRDVETGRLVESVPVDRTLNWPVRLVASSDGQFLAVPGDPLAKIWNVGGGPSKPLTIRHRNIMTNLAFSLDGAQLITGSFDQTAQVWSVAGRPAGPPLPHTANVTFCFFAADYHVVTAQADGLVRVWKLPRTEPAASAMGWNVRSDTLGRISPDRRLVTPGAWYETPIPNNEWAARELTVLEVFSGKAAGPTIRFDHDAFDSRVCADNRSAAVVTVEGGSGWFSVHDVPSGRVVVPPVALPGAPASVAARPGRPEAAVLCRSGELVVFDVRDGTRRLELKPDVWKPTRYHFSRVEYTPDGATMVVLSGGDMTIAVRDADSGVLRFPPIRPVLESGPLRSMTVSPDSRLLATAVNGRNAAQVWDLMNGKALSVPLPHPGDFWGVYGVTFTRDGQRILTGGKDGHVRVWDWMSGKQVCPAMNHGDEVYTIAVTDDGRHAVTGTRDGKVWVWELTTGKPVAPPWRAGGSVWSVDLCQGRVVTAGGGRCTSIDLDRLLGEPATSAKDLRLLGELAANRKVELGDVSLVTADEWRERWELHRRRLAAKERVVGRIAADND